MNIRKLQKVIGSGNFEWRKHALQRTAERGIPQKAIFDVFLYGEQIENYPEDTPYRSALFLGWYEGKPLHVVVALDEGNNWAYIITAYEPSMEEFEPDFKTRRKKP